MIQLPARTLAVALHNVGLGSGEADQAALNKTIAIEVYDDSTIGLVASSGSILLRSVVGLHGTPDPAIADKPKQTIIAISRYKLLASFVTHVLAVTKDDGPGIDRRVVLDVRAESLDEAAPKLAGMERQVLSIEADDFQAQLYLVEGEAYPDWRKAWPDVKDEVAIRNVALNPQHLKVFAAMKDTASAPRFSFFGDGQPVLVTVDGEPSVRGLLLPRTITEAEDEIDELRALWDLPSHEEGS